MSLNRDDARQKRARMVVDALKRHEPLLLELEKMHPGEYVAISINTGRYVVTDDDVARQRFALSLEPDDFIRCTRIGSL
jgi:hypothetical protein